MGDDRAVVGRNGVRNGVRKVVRGVQLDHLVNAALVQRCQLLSNLFNRRNGGLRGGSRSRSRSRSRFAGFSEIVNTGKNCEESVENVRFLPVWPLLHKGSVNIDGSIVCVDRLEVQKQQMDFVLQIQLFVGLAGKFGKQDVAIGRYEVEEHFEIKEASFR